jgi:hypothetical protein
MAVTWLNFINHAATKLAVSKRPMAGKKRLSGITIQSVTAKTKRPMGF